MWSLSVRTTYKSQCTVFWFSRPMYVRRTRYNCVKGSVSEVKPLCWDNDNLVAVLISGHYISAREIRVKLTSTISRQNNAQEAEQWHALHRRVRIAYCHEDVFDVARDDVSERAHHYDVLGPYCCMNCTKLAQQRKLRRLRDMFFRRFLVSSALRLETDIHRARKAGAWRQVAFAIWLLATQRPEPGLPIWTEKCQTPQIWDI